MFVASTRPTAGLLARGSAPRPAFPAARASSGLVGQDFPLTVAGAAADLATLRRVRTAFPFHPLARDRRCSSDRFRRPACQSGARFAPRLQVMSSVPKLTLVLGGARSGKSRYAESLIAALPPPWDRLAYVATAEAGDEEMAARIAAHRARRGADWRTVEAPRDLAAALAVCRTTPVLVDCLTLWLSNLMLAEADIDAEIAQLEKALGGRRRAGRPGRQRGGFRHRAGSSARPPFSRHAGHPQPAHRGARRPGRSHGRGLAGRR